MREGETDTGTHTTLSPHSSSFIQDEHPRQHGRTDLAGSTELRILSPSSRRAGIAQVQLAPYSICVAHNIQITDL